MFMVLDLLACIAHFPLWFQFDSMFVQSKRQLFALIVWAIHLQIIKTVIAKANSLFSAISQTLQYVTRCGFGQINIYVDSAFHFWFIESQFSLLWFRIGTLINFIFALHLIAKNRCHYSNVFVSIFVSFLVFHWQATIMGPVSSSFTLIHLFVLIPWNHRAAHVCGAFSSDNHFLTCFLFTLSKQTAGQSVPRWCFFLNNTFSDRLPVQTTKSGFHNAYIPPQH